MKVNSFLIPAWNGPESEVHCKNSNPNMCVCLYFIFLIMLQIKVRWTGFPLLNSLWLCAPFPHSTWETILGPGHAWTARVYFGIHDQVEKKNQWSFLSCISWFILDLFSCSSIYYHTDSQGYPRSLEKTIFSLITEDDGVEVIVQLKLDLRSIEKLSFRLIWRA